MRQVILGVVIGASVPLVKLMVELFLTRTRQMRADEISRMAVRAANDTTRVALALSKKGVPAAGSSAPH